MNSFMQLFKIYVNKVDNILKSNNEEKPYPVLKSQNENDLIQFLNEIYNYQIVNDNQDYIPFQICEPIKIYIIKAFRLDVSFLDLIDDDFLEDETNLIVKKLKIKNKQSDDYNINHNEIKIIIRNELISNLKKI